MAETGPALLALTAVTAASAGAQAYLAVDAADAQKRAVRKQEQQAKSLLAEQRTLDKQKREGEINLAKRKAASLNFKAPDSISPTLMSGRLGYGKGKQLVGQ